MRIYDLVVVYSPDLSDDDAARATDEVRSALTAGGKILKDEAWGRRKLAYLIQRKREGIYHYFQAESEAKTVSEIDRRLRLSDNVLRHLTVRYDNEARRAAKASARRAAKAARKPPKPARPAAPETAAPEQPAE